MEKETFLKFYNNFKSIKEINKDLLLSVILEFIIDLDFNEIDHSRSKFETRADGYSVNLLCNNNRKCDLYIEVLNYNEVDVQLNTGGEYLYLQPINSWADVSNLRKALADIFLEAIEERLISCDGKVKQMTYTVSHRLENGIDRKSYSSVLGACWFWQRKEVKEKVYEPWITRNDFSD